MFCFAFAPFTSTRDVPTPFWQILHDKRAGQSDILSSAAISPRFFARNFCTYRKRVLHLHSEKTAKGHTVDVAQLVRASDCGSEGRGFEPLLPPSRRKKITPQRANPYVSMIRKVFCFRGIVYSESGCPLLDPAPFVPVREEDANCGRCVGFHRCAFNSLHAAYV